MNARVAPTTKDLEPRRRTPPRPAPPPGRVKARAPAAARPAAGEQPRRVRRSQARREAILRAAARAFREHGYHQTTLDQVAEALLMTKGSFYYYFRSKEDILFALHDDSLDRAIELLARTRREEPSAPRQLALIIEGHLDVIFDELQASGIVLDLSALTPEHYRQIVEKRDRFERGLREIIRSGVRAGDFVPCDPTVVTFAILGSINWVARWFKPGGRLGPRGVARQFSDFLVRGLVCERRGSFCPLGLKQGESC